MRTANRKPKLNKPTKGIKTQLKQSLKALKKAIAITAEPIKRKEQYWHTPKALRASWLLSMRGSFMPHQGPKECARRVRQMEAGIIKP